MVLVDTSIWVAHFRNGNAQLSDLLNDGQVLCHPFIVGELACGLLKRRVKILTHLQALPQAEVAEDDEILEFIDQRRLMGKGIGLVDVHLLASALLTNVLLWTTDRRLRSAAVAFKVGYR